MDSGGSAALGHVGICRHCVALTPKAEQSDQSGKLRPGGDSGQNQDFLMKAGRAGSDDWKS